MDASHKIRNAIIGGGALLIAMFAGCAIGTGSGSDTAAPGPTKTVTVTKPGAAKPAPTVTVTVTAKAKAEPKAEPGSVISGSAGTLVVGKDIKPGTYISKGNSAGGGCYWERLDKAGNIIDNGLPVGQGVVKVRASDAGFSTAGCADWHRQ